MLYVISTSSPHICEGRTGQEGTPPKQTTAVRGHKQSHIQAPSSLAFSSLRCLFWMLAGQARQVPPVTALRCFLQAIF